MCLASHLRNVALLMVINICIEPAASLTPCDSFQCLHGGTCVININREPHCQCVLNYFGEHCEYSSDTHLCTREICKNGAKCGQQEDVATVTCFCVPGYHGSYCDQEYNECASDPCMHGTCIDGINRYSCECEDLWYGVHCNSYQPKGPTTNGLDPKGDGNLVAGLATGGALICCVLVVIACRYSVWRRRRLTRVADSHIELNDDGRSLRKFNVPLPTLRSRLVR